MHKGHKIVTLCGSTRFKDEFLEMAARLTLEGYIVLSVGVFGHSGDAERYKIDYESGGVKEMLDEVHKAKIDLSDEICVINKGGYVGESTKGEIAYAKERGLAVRWMEPEHALEDAGEEG